MTAMTSDGRPVEQFADKDKYEFMLLDSYGGVIASSSGTDAEGIVSSKDFEQALNGPDGLGVAVYRTQSGEVVMAACSLVPYDAEDVAALRLVTSLALVERQGHRGAAGAGGTHRCRHRPGRAGCASAPDRRPPRRGGSAARHHQSDGRGTGRDREDEERVH